MDENGLDEKLARLVKELTALDDFVGSDKFDKLPENEQKLRFREAQLTVYLIGVVRARIAVRDAKRKGG